MFNRDLAASVVLLVVVFGIVSYPIVWEYTNNLGEFDNRLRSGYIKFDYEHTVNGMRCITAVGKGNFFVDSSYDWVKLDTYYYVSWHIARTFNPVTGPVHTPTLDNVMLVDG